jgi:RNA polymerase primary sigma factor
MIRIPVNRIPEVRQTLYARAHLAEELDRQPRPEEIAKEIGLPTHKVEELLPAIAPIDSMDAPLGSSERKLGDLLEDRTTPTPLDDAMEAETQRAIRAVLHELPDRQRVILCMRHGIGYPRECTLEEIGDELGLSRERIRQVEKVAAASVRDWLQEHRPQLATPV